MIYVKISSGNLLEMKASVTVLIELAPDERAKIRVHIS